jgi:hypothetical protein
MHGLEVEPQGRILNVLLAAWYRVCDLLGDTANFAKVRTVANALLMYGGLDASEVDRRMSRASEPTSILSNALIDALPAIRAAGAELLKEQHSDYLSPSGTRLGRHMTLN